MTIIKQYVDKIGDELESAKEYAEKYVEYKSKNNQTWMNKYKEMANDEIKHAMYLHDRAIEQINMLSNTFKPTVEMQNKWDKSHAEYVEKTAWIKQMLQM